MTLLEVLVVAFVIAILVAMLMPVNSPNGHPKFMQARVEIAGLEAGIEAYEQTYGHLPLTDVMTNGDLTIGLKPAEVQAFNFLPGTKLIATNSDLIVVLMDFDRAVNAGHKLNPRQIKFLNAKMVEGTNSPGVSCVDYQYRDPWGHPYIISLDANQDGFVRDAFYAQAALYTKGQSAPLTNRNGLYELSSKGMVWSRGRDGKASLTQPATGGVNQDNVTSW